MDYCVWMRIPATSRRNPTNPDKIGTQPAKKNRKNQQKSIVKFLKISDPGGPPEPPESVRDPSGTRPSEENAKKRFPAAKKSKRYALRDRFWRFSGPGREPKIDKKRARRRKSASGDGAGSDFCRFFSRSPFGVALRTDFWRVRPLKILLFPQREHDFDKITVFKKTPKK